MSKNNRNRKKTNSHPAINNTNREMRVMQTVATYSGPIPPAQELEKYESILPGAADRILAMAEKQSNHRQHMEKQMISAKIKAEKRGQVFGFIVFLVALLLGVVFVVLGQNLIGISVFVGNIAAIVTLFIYGKHSEKKELEDKKQKIKKEQ